MFTMYWCKKQMCEFTISIFYILTASWIMPQSRCCLRALSVKNKKKKKKKNHLRGNFIVQSKLLSISQLDEY